MYMCILSKRSFRPYWFHARVCKAVTEVEMKRDLHANHLVHDCR